MEYAQEETVIIFFMREKKINKKNFVETDGGVEQCWCGGWGKLSSSDAFRWTLERKWLFGWWHQRLWMNGGRSWKPDIKKRDQSKLLKCTFILLNIFRAAELRQPANSTSWRILIEKLTGLGKNFSFHKSFAVTIPKSQQIF